MPSATSRAAVPEGILQEEVRIEPELASTATTASTSSVGSRSRSTSAAVGSSRSFVVPRAEVRVRRTVVFAHEGPESGREAANREHDDARGEHQRAGQHGLRPQGRERCPGLEIHALLGQTRSGEVRAALGIRSVGRAEVGGELALTHVRQLLAKERNPRRGVRPPREGGRATKFAAERDALGAQASERVGEASGQLVELLGRGE